MDPQHRARIAVALAGVALFGGMVSLVAWRVDVGLAFDASDGIVRISDVSEYGPAAAEGFVPGMAVVDLNGERLLQLPEYVYASPDANGNVPDQPIGIAPDVPTPVGLDPGIETRLFRSSVHELAAIPASNLGTHDPGAIRLIFLSRDYLAELERTGFPYVAGIGLLLAGSWWLLGGRGGRSLQGMAFPLAVAVSVPLLARPLEATWSAPQLALAGLVVPLAMVPLAQALLERVPEGPARPTIRAGVVAFAAAAGTLGLARILVPGSFSITSSLWQVLSAGIPIIPGLAAATPSMTAPTEGATGGRLLQSAELAVAGATPAVAIMTPSTPWTFLFPLSAWLVLVLLAGRFTIRPLARLAVRAQLQRDLVVAATEAERARVAADIHDDALQELTLLVRRLDEAGDSEGADMARTVSDRLRAICGDLRLPILDDLGVGPALDWLVTRIERLAGGEVRLERSDGSRLPPQVELGIFRVAQEALANAVKHGRPPIIVRYRATETGASLSIDDAGAGIEPDAAAKAEAEGRFGLLNMQQRAEQIGAILDVRRWPGGGTHVALEWRAR